MSAATHERDGVVAYRLWTMQPRGLVGPYYVDWTSTRRARAGETSSGDGAIAHAKAALDVHATWWATRSQAHRKDFLDLAARLRDRDDGAGRYPCPGGYLSATAQSLAVSALIRAHALEKNDGYLDAALRASTSLRQTIADGGVLYRAYGDTILEAIAVSPPTHRLEGSIVGCWGLIELQRVAFVPWAGAILGPAIGTLQRRIARYDLGGWSFASDDDVADAQTHELHIALLHVFASMIGDATFERLAGAWARRRQPATA